MTSTPEHDGTVKVADKIEKRVVLRAPLARVWRAISDSAQFGSWFGVAFEGPFVPGQPLRGKIVPTTADPDVAKMQEPYKGANFDITVEKLEPEKEFAFRWHPFAIDPGADYSQEPTTLVVFGLKEVPDGVELTITESGFDRIPLARRAQAFTANDGGWTHQAKLVEKYLAQTA
ncbi:MAG TPA: SRPBCC family protein [Polyangiaceae bacterium]|nr:SRPBCC family protein [Polyangiaceae bacterium]